MSDERYRQGVDLNPVLSELGHYPIAMVARRAAERRERGLPVIDFSIGDPREPTPTFIADALRSSVPEISQYPTAAGRAGRTGRGRRGGDRRAGRGKRPAAARGGAAMIVPMQKIYLAARQTDRDRTLDVLRRVGIVHLVPVDPALAVPDEATTRQVNAEMIKADQAPSP